MDVKPGYQDTEVGVIPEDWVASQLDQLVNPGSPICYGIVQVGKNVPAGVPIVAIKHVKDIGTAQLHKASQATEKPYSRSRVRGGDVLISIKGTIGRVGIVPDGFQGNISRDLARLSPRSDHCGELIAYQLEAPGTQERIARAIVGTTRQEFSIAALRRFVIPTPEKLSEQRAIASALSDVDALIAKLDQLIAKKRDLKQAAMQELLTGRRRLPGFSGEWQVTALSDLENRRVLRLGRGQVISRRDIEDTPGDYPIYSSSVQNEGQFGTYGKFMFDEELITWSIDGGGDFFHRKQRRFSVTNVCGFIRVDTNQINYRYLASCLQFLHNQKSFDYQTKAHPSVIRKEYTVTLPSLQEQSAIAAVLSDMDAEITALEARRDKTKLLKQGMMQELLTGRIRLV